MSLKFSRLKHFKPSEFSEENPYLAEQGGNPNRMSELFLLRLDNYREALGHPIHIVSSTGGDHTTGSLHYSGHAVDCFIGGNPPVFDCLILAAQWFGGIGYYPDWKYTPQGGFHFDYEPSKQRRKWMGVWDPKAGKQQYIALNYANMLQHGVF